MRHNFIPACVLLGLIASVPVFTGIAPIPDSLRRCAKELDATQRLACFDALVVSLPAVEADQFGLTAEIAKRQPASQGRHAVKTESGGAEAVLPATIAELGRAPDDRLVFTLDNGQVWIQAEVAPGPRVAVGEKVRIEHGALSSLWLITSRGRELRVTRIR